MASIDRITRQVQRGGVLALFTCTVLSVLRVSALPPEYYAVDVVCDAQVAPTALVFDWPQVDYARQYFIRKRADSQAPWSEPIAVLPGSASGYIDTAIEAGRAYEYEIEKQLTTLGYEGEFISAYSYVYGGVNVQLPDHKGKALLLIDAAIASGIQDSLRTYQQDLIGAGWTVVTRQVERSSSPPNVKSLIQAEANANPDLRSVVLIGHVPVPYSGEIAPDLHATHRGAWPADVYYAVPDGVWSDNTVSITSYDSELNDNNPGDGKFDQSEIPGTVTLEIGRIDFWDLPSFTGRNEIDLLKAYFQKNHAFRHKAFSAARRALLHDNFGDVEGDAPAVDAWRHFPQFFGHGSVRSVGPGEFLPMLAQESFLWAYGAGGGSFSKADGVADTQTLAVRDPKAVFYILHGSYFGDWNSTDNLLRAAIATPSMSLVSIWSGLPHWYMHHLGLGGTIGFSTRLTQNNRGTYKSYRNFSRGQVHISLIGDPTLEMLPVSPPESLTASVRDAQVDLSWNRSNDEQIVGYNIYRSTAPDGPYSSTGSVGADQLTYRDQPSTGSNFYMVRAVKLERTGSGTYYNLSQGTFATASVVLKPTNSISFSGGSFVIDISGPPQRVYNLQVTTNGKDWTTITSGTSDPEGRAQYGAQPTHEHLNLYRVLWP